MTQPEDYDLVILGDGIGSTLAAWTFAAEGERVGPRGLGESGQSGRPHLGDVPRRGVSSTGVRYARASTRPMLS